MILLLTLEFFAAAVVLTREPAIQLMPPVAPPARPADSALIVGSGRTERLVNLGGPDADRLLAGISADIGTAVNDVEGFWGVDWSHDIEIVATGSDRQFWAEAGGGSAPQWADIAAVAVADRVDPDRRITVGQRIVFAPGAAAMSASALRTVLTHELFHYAARADTALDAPRWLTEGVADFVARPPAVLPDAATLIAKLPSDADLDAPGPQRSLGYDRAWWFARFVSGNYGAAKLRELYLAACGAGHVDPATAMRAVLGADPEALLARWQQWMAR